MLNSDQLRTVRVSLLSLLRVCFGRRIVRRDGCWHLLLLQPTMHLVAYFVAPSAYLAQKSPCLRVDDAFQGENGAAFERTYCLRTGRVERRVTPFTPSAQAHQPAWRWLTRCSAHLAGLPPRAGTACLEVWCLPNWVASARSRRGGSIRTARRGCAKLPTRAIYIAKRRALLGSPTRGAGIRTVITLGRMPFVGRRWSCALDRRQPVQPGIA
jgi:hypothetical protein